jgi:2,3-dihydroxyphenylpropionate 1,2-dioxygenase
MSDSTTRSEAYLACVPHVPLLAMQEREINAEFWSAYEARVAELNAFDPDLVVVFGGDHYDNLFLNLAPQFLLGHVAEAVADCGGRAGKLDVPLEISRQCARFLVEDGFDIATSYAMSVDHGFSNVLANFLGELDARPVLPIHVNSLSDPRPTLRRCRQLGEAVGRFADTLGKRVAFLGSGGLSHQTDFIFPQYDTAADQTVRDYIVSGGSRGPISREAWMAEVRQGMNGLNTQLLDEDLKVPWINAEWDHAFLESFTSGDLTRFDSWTDEDILASAGYGGGEVRMWVAAAAAARAAGAGDLVLDYYSAETTLAVGLGVVHSRTAVAS